ncbi:MAG TPA: amidohydrolase family protein [Trebonia sp.]
MPYAPDLLLVNANVRTMDPARPRAAAVAVTGGRIAGVGDDAAEAAGGAAAGNVIDLKGATLIPGFHDAHNHMAGFGLLLTEVDLRVDSLDELYARVAARAAAGPPGGWITGAGYDQTKTGAHPHRDARDRIAPAHRVQLKHTSSHMCVVNSLVLADLGIDREVPHVDGGRVTADASGRPTGLMEERAQPDRRPAGHRDDRRRPAAVRRPGLTGTGVMSQASCRRRQAAVVQGPFHSTCQVRPPSEVATMRSWDLLCPGEP